MYLDAKHVRNISIPSFLALRELFEKDRAAGKGAETGKEKMRRWAREGRESNGGESSRIEEIDQLVADKEIRLESLDDFEDDNIQQTSIPRSSSTNVISKGGKKKVSKSDDLNERLDNLNATISQIAKVMDINELSKRRMQAVYTELKKLDGVDQNFVFAANDFLMSNPVAADFFLGLPNDDRICWLSWKMNNSS